MIQPQQPRTMLQPSAAMNSYNNSNPFQNSFAPSAMNNYADGPVRRKSTVSEYQFILDRPTPAEILGDFPVRLSIKTKIPYFVKLIFFFFSFSVNFATSSIV